MGASGSVQPGERPRVRPVGRTALLVEVGAAEVARWYAALAGLRESGRVRDVVPGARNVLLDGIVDPAGVAALVSGMQPPELPPGDGPVIEIAVRYDGPDLDEVARIWRCDRAGVVTVHTGTPFRVAFTGFSPGFGYLSGLPAERHVPRRATPRTRVPAGSVGLAGEWSGVYPSPSPGGWQLIGTTPLAMFDPRRDPPALLTPGTRVRFRDADGPP